MKRLLHGGLEKLPRQPLRQTRDHRFVGQASKQTVWIDESADAVQEDPVISRMKPVGREPVPEKFAQRGEVFLPETRRSLIVVRIASS